jgi:hypothetical protein
VSVSFLGEVAKRSNALGSGPSPSGSRVRFSPSSCIRRGVVGNMSGFHPVASGSIPGSGSIFSACIAQWQSGALVMLRSGIQSSVQAAAIVSFCSRSSVGRAPALHAGGLGFDPRRELFFAPSVCDAEATGSIPVLGCHGPFSSVGRAWCLYLRRRGKGQGRGFDPRTELELRWRSGSACPSYTFAVFLLLC